MARLLIVVMREPDHGPALRELGRKAFRFLAESQTATGRTRNRRSTNGRWHGRPSVDDCWGRSVWAFGTTARRAPDEGTRSSARSYFDHAVKHRSPHRRAMAFAALGAAEMAAVAPRHSGARALLRDAVDAIGTPTANAVWPWPEPRLAYANAALPEALIAAGDVLGRPDVLADGLELLRWLLEREQLDGHLSPAPVDGSGPRDSNGRFDQQPIEVAALADACARARALTGDAAWDRGVEQTLAWFAGANDTGSQMFDPATGGGYDGLTATGPNLNQGAESTLALISTLQHAARPVVAPRAPGFIWSTG